MTFRLPWDETQPLGSYPADVIDDEIRNLKSRIADRMRGFLPGWANDDEDPKEFISWILVKNDVTTIPPLTITPITWEVISRESGGDFVGLSPITTVTIPVGLGGLYLMGTGVVWPTTILTGMTLLLRINNVTRGVDRDPDVALFSTKINYIERLYQLSGGDQIQIAGFQTTGGNQDIVVEGTYFYGIRLGG